MATHWTPMSERTVFRTKRRYAEEGLDEVLRHHNGVQVNRPRKVRNRGGPPVSHWPAGCPTVMTWTMRALAGKVVELGLVESLPPGRWPAAKKNTLKLVQETMVHPR